VALRERGDEQLERVPPRSVVKKSNSRVGDHWRCIEANLVVATVCAIVAGAELATACPLHKNLVDVRAVYYDMVRILARRSRCFSAWFRVTRQNERSSTQIEVNRLFLSQGASAGSKASTYRRAAAHQSHDELPWR
jgi:hypothetical protein